MTERGNNEETKTKERGPCGPCVHSNIYRAGAGRTCRKVAAMIEQFKLIFKHEMVFEEYTAKIDDPITITYTIPQLENVRCVPKTEIVKNLFIILKEQIERVDNE